MKENKYITVPQLANLLGVSRVTVFKKVKAGEINAILIGRNYAIPMKEVAYVLGKKLTEKSKEEIDHGLDRVVSEYGQVLRLLAKV